MEPQCLEFPTTAILTILNKENLPLIIHIYGQCP